MFRFITILFLSFLSCIAVNAQSKTLPDALFSTDGKYALILHNSYSDSDGYWCERYLFSNINNSVKEILTQRNDTFTAYGYDTASTEIDYLDKNSYVIATFGKTQIKDYLSKYQLYIEPKNITEQLSYTIDTFKIDQEKITYYDDSLPVRRYNIEYSLFYQNKLLQRDTVNTNIDPTTKHIPGDDWKAYSPSTHLSIEKKYSGYALNTKLYFDSQSKFYWLCSGIFVNKFYPVTKRHFDENGETTMNLIESEGIRNFIKFGKLN